MSAEATETLPFDPVDHARAQWSQHGWSEAAEGMAAITSVVRAQQIYLSRIEATLRPFGITFARYEVLMLLQFSRRGALPMRVIGSRLQVHPTSVTNVVDRLAKADLVTRSPDPHDRRVVLVEITDEGRRVAEQATDALNADVFTRPGLVQSDLTNLISILARLRQSAGDF